MEYYGIAGVYGILWNIMEYYGIWEVTQTNYETVVLVQKQCIYGDVWQFVSGQ